MVRRSLLALLGACLWLATARPAWAAGKEVNIFEPRVDLGIWTVIVFLGLYFILKKYAFKPMLEGLDKREKGILQAIEEAKKTREEAQIARDKLQKELAGANETIRNMMEEARKDAQHVKDDMISQAKKEIGEEQERRKRELDLAKEQALDEITTHTAQLVTLVSAKLIRKELNPADHRGLVDEALVDLKTASSHRVTSL